MGVVYRAEDAKLERTVALKFLSLTSIGEEEKKRFKRQAKPAASLSHPNIATIHAIDEANALEGVARTVLDDRSILLSPALERIKNEKGLHGALKESIEKIFAYASDSGGRHGLVGDPQVDSRIAEFCLHQCAAATVFIARLYGYEQQVVTR